jgi:CRP/FNR family transcriptional regulator, nitrogen fixation regulation protein
MLTQTVDRYVAPYRSGVGAALEPAKKSDGAFGGKEKTFKPNEELFSEGESADYVYKVLRGAVRSYKSLGEGRRKIEAFRLRGDVFGLDPGKEREFCAEAIDEVCVLVARRRTTVGTTVDYEAIRELCEATTRELQRVQQHALLLAMSARQRMACFLIEMSQRFGVPDIVELPMSRQDIADYLGLSIETVSRTFAKFGASGLVSLPTSRHVVLRDPDALQRISE